MGDDVVLTPNLKVDLQGIPYATVSGNYRVTRDLVQRTATEDTSSRVKPSPIRKITLTLVAQLDPDAEYYGPPLDLFGAPGLWVRIWLNGRGDLGNLIDIPTLFPGEQGGDWNMQGSAAQTVSIQGESDGDFFLPGE